MRGGVRGGVTLSFLLNMIYKNEEGHFMRISLNTVNHKDIGKVAPEVPIILFTIKNENK